MIIAVIQFFDTIFVVRFRHSLKIGLSFGDYIFISAKFLTSKHSFEVCKQKKGLWGPDLENTVDGEATRSLIHAILPSF
jgi:hypothetical protein